MNGMAHSRRKRTNKNILSYLILPQFYGHYTGQPALAGNPSEEVLRNLFQQSFTAPIACADWQAI